MVGSSVEYANVLGGGWLGTFMTPEAGLLRAMQGRATAVAGEFNPQEVANTVWAHACFGGPLLEMASTLDVEGERQSASMAVDVRPGAVVGPFLSGAGESSEARAWRALPSDLQVHLALISRERRRQGAAEIVSRLCDHLGT